MHDRYGSKEVGAH